MKYKYNLFFLQIFFATFLKHKPHLLKLVIQPLGARRLLTPFLKKLFLFLLYIGTLEHVESKSETIFEI